MPMKLLDYLCSIDPTQPKAFQDAGLFCSHRAAREPITHIVVNASVDVIWRPSTTHTLVIVSRSSQAACDLTDTHIHATTLTIERHGNSPGVFVRGSENHVSTGDLVIIGDGNVVSGRAALSGRAAHPDPAEQAVVLITQPNAPDIQLRGNANVLLRDIHQHSLTLQLAGSGDIEINGQLDRLTADVNGSGTIRSNKLIAQSVNCSVTGSGTISAQCLQSVRARVTGSGNIIVHGAPVARDTGVTGSGNIRFST